MSRRNAGSDRPTVVGHLVDLVLFRSAGVALIAWEVVPEAAADWHVLVAGFACFFMPDALRGRSSIVWRLLGAVVSREGER